MRVVDAASPEVAALLDAHLALMRSLSPPEDVHALDAAGRRDAALTTYGLRVDGVLVATGALKDLGDGVLEVKAMHVRADARGRGHARTLVAHLVEQARARGARRLCLETGSTPAFAPARALYLSCGFAPCGPFGDYAASAHSTFLALTPARP